MKTKFIFLFVLFFICFNKIYSQYKIEIKVVGLENKFANLCYYKDSKTYSVDTAFFDLKGEAIFSGNKKLHGGLYFITCEDVFYKEILISNDQIFKVQCKSVLLKSCSVKGDIDNEVFNDYINYLNRKKLELFKSMELENIKEIKQKIVKNIKEYKDNIIRKYKGRFISDFFKMQQERSLESFKDTNKIYRYYVDHYWDNYTFKDSSILRTNFFIEDLNYFFDEILYQRSGFLSKHIEKLLSLSLSNKPLYKYLVKYFYNKYSSTNIMGLDSLFVSFSEKYIINSEVKIVDSAFVVNLKNRVRLMKPNLIGSVAKDIKNTVTYDEEYVTLSKINSEFLVMIFWDVNCGFCKKEVAALHKITKLLDEKYNTKVYSFYTHNDEKQWKEYIEEKKIFGWINTYDKLNQTNFRNNYNIYKTPIIYILDKNKKIIAKNISVSQIIHVIENIDRY